MVFALFRRADRKQTDNVERHDIILGGVVACPNTPEDDVDATNTPWPLFCYARCQHFTGGVDGGAENAGVENAGVDNTARDDKGGQGGSGQRGMK